MPKYFLAGDLVIVMKRSVENDKGKKPLSKKEIDVLKKLSIDWKVHTKEEEIDHILYGDSGKRPALSNIVGVGKSGTKGNVVTLKKRIQRGEI